MSSSYSVFPYSLNPLASSLTSNDTKAIAIAKFNRFPAVGKKVLHPPNEERKAPKTQMILQARNIKLPTLGLIQEASQRGIKMKNWTNPKKVKMVHGALKKQKLCKPTIGINYKIKFIKS